MWAVFQTTTFGTRLGEVVYLQSRILKRRPELVPEGFLLCTALGHATSTFSPDIAYAVSRGSTPPEILAQRGRRVTGVRF
jgi:hypothetical protein